MGIGIYSGVDEVAKKIKIAYGGVEKETADNILINGSLYASAKEWTISSANTLTQNDGYASIKCTSTGTGTYPNYQAFNIVSGDTSDTVQILYACAKVRGKATNVSYPRVYLSSYANSTTETTYYNLKSIDEKNGIDLNDGEWHIVSGRVVTYNTESDNYWEYYRIAFGISASTTDDEMDIKEVFLVNLTETFGRGNEPSKVWCDENLTNYAEKIPIDCKGIAKKIIKGYIGVDNIARPFFTSEQKLVRYGIITPLSNGMRDLQAVSMKNYALFTAGTSGSTDNTYYDTVDTYNKNLIKGTADKLSVKRKNTCGGYIDGYALIAGGVASSKSDVVDTYDENLVKGLAPNLSSARHIIASASAGNYLLFAGGYSYDNTTVEYSTVDTYDKNLVKGTASDLSEARYYHMGASVGNYMIFAGGYVNSKGVSTVDCYNKNLVKISISTLSEIKYYGASVSTKKYAFFGGGIDKANGTKRTSVDIYDENLVKGLADDLSSARYKLTGISIGDYILFAGGYPATSGKTVDTYDLNLVKGLADDLSYTRTELASASIGDHVLFAGGYGTVSSSITYHDTVEAYQIV